MKTWTVSQARAAIADVFDAALQDGPQRIERRDTESVVVVSAADWARLAAEYADLTDFVVNAPFSSDDLPSRKSARITGSDKGL